MSSVSTEQQHWSDELVHPPPGWAVLTVKCCCGGIIALPLLTTALVLLTALLDLPAVFSAVAIVVSIALLTGMIACADYLAARYPRGPRRPHPG